MGATQAPEATMATTVMVVVTVTVTEANSDGPSSVPGTVWTASRPPRSMLTVRLGSPSQNRPLVILGNTEAQRGLVTRPQVSRLVRGRAAPRWPSPLSTSGPRPSHCNHLAPLHVAPVFTV